MRHAALAVLVALLIGCTYAHRTGSPAPAEPRGAAGRPAALQAEGSTLVAYIVNQNSDEITAIDVNARALVGRAQTGRNPHEIAALPDGSRLFTSDEQGVGDGPDGMVLLSRAS